MKIKTLVLQTHMFDELADFYGQLIQLPLARAGGSFTATVGKSSLVFERAMNPVSPFYHFAFNIPSNKIEEAKQWLEERTELLLLDDYNGRIAEFESWHARSVYFFDPAGNIVELIARLDLKDISSESFTQKHIRNISEVGIVYPAEQFNAKIDGLMQQYQLPYFDKQPPLPQFRAIGNDEGLFICVPEHRAWYPTKDRPAAIYPITVYISVADQLIELKP